MSRQNMQEHRIWQCIFYTFNRIWDLATQKKLVISFVLLFVLCATSGRFYHKANAFADVESHIPASILAQAYGYDLEGYGLSFVNAEGIKNTYGEGALKILQEGIEPLSFRHYTSTIGIQGYMYAWLYKALGLKTLRPLYALNAFLSALSLIICAFLLGKIFGRGFGIIFFISLFIGSWVAKFGGSLYFSLAFWILPTIIALKLYRHIQLGGGHKMMGFILCIAYMFSISLRAAMSYEFITSIILFSLSPFLVSLLYGLLTHKSPPLNAPFMNLPPKQALKYALLLFILAMFGSGIVFVIHTYIRGGGDVWAGLMDIYQKDFLRRMVGGNPKDFSPVYAASLTANAFEVIALYLTAEVKFLVLLSISCYVCIIESTKPYRNFYIALMVCFALPALSWFILGKSHSYIHRHFCFVLWYLGFYASIVFIPCSFLYRHFSPHIHKEAV